MISLRDGATALDTLEAIYREGAAPALDAAARPRVEASAALVCRAAAGEAAVYGVNTGFGKLAGRKIHAEDTRTLQRNLISSHCCGVGAALPRAETRLMIALKLLSLGRGASGVRWAVIDTLHALLERAVILRVPSQGSVGASGDLAPLAHMAAVLIGEGEAFYRGERLPGKEALRRAGIAPLALGPKEGLALINGTRFSSANALAALFNVRRLAQSALLASALSTDAIMGSTVPLKAEIHRLRGHRGQIDVADRMASMMRGSEIRESHRDGDSRVQDPYCIGCQPQVLGAALDVLRMAAATLTVEAKAVTDNPLVLVEGGEIASGGNFHAEPLGFAADMIAQRRVALIVDMARGRIAFQGLPARICWVGLGLRHKLGLAFNAMVRRGELAAPVVIGRDHLDSGSAASPSRETESVRDGSDAVSEWPLLNALLNTASGATWVSLHHGGGVGMGFSQHAGMAICCDGSIEADRRLARVLWNDPASGVMRHADAGYPIARDCAAQHHLNLPGIL